MSRVGTVEWWLLKWYFRLNWHVQCDNNEHSQRGGFPSMAYHFCQLLLLYWYENDAHIISAKTVPFYAHITCFWWCIERSYETPVMHNLQHLLAETSFFYPLRRTKHLSCNGMNFITDTLDAVNSQMRVSLQMHAYMFLYFVQTRHHLSAHLQSTWNQSLGFPFFSYCF